jgi:hypothetical protein
MKKILSIFSILSLLTSCASSQERTDNTLVEIEYTNNINGYIVKAYWLPKKVKYEHIIGPAIMSFYNIVDSSTFTLTSDNFSILKSRVKANYNDDSTELISLKENNLKLTYQKYQFKAESFGTTREPFFFKDVDFDKSKELIISEVDNGQRGVATFKVYKFEYDDISNDFRSITNQEPFKSLDEMSKIDYTNKRIIIHGSGGACGGTDEIYVQQPSKDNYEESKFVLESIIEEQNDSKTNNCYKVAYKISQTKQLLFKKLVR